MAPPPKVTRALVARLIRRWDDDIRPEAAKRGHDLPSPEFGDGMTRATAREMRMAAQRIPEIRRALLDRGGLQNEAQAFLRVLTYFESAHPQTAAGAPAPWPASETLSPTMAAFARRDTNALDPAAMLPGELEAMTVYAQARNDPADFEGAAGEQVRAEVEQLIGAAEKAAETTPMFDTGSTTGMEGTTMTDQATQTAARDRRDALLADPAFEARYHSPHRNIRERAIAEMQKAIAGDQQNPAPPPRAESVARNLVTREMLARPTQQARAAPKYHPDAVREALKGLSPSQRQTKLAQMYPGSGVTGTDAASGSAGVDAAPGAEAA